MFSTRQNQLQTIDAATLKQGLNQQTVTLIDVREPSEFAEEHIRGAVLVSLSKFDPRQIPQTPGKQLVLYCRSGGRSAIAAQKLLDAGFQQVSHLGNGIAAWKQAGYPTAH